MKRKRWIEGEKERKHGRQASKNEEKENKMEGYQTRHRRRKKDLKELGKKKCLPFLRN